jgi:hypothetical protein
MHSDVLELFIIVSSVPVLHLSQDENSSSTQTVLKAGRISAQDMMSDETTGENIMKETLSDSTIVYGRFGEEVLIAIRVKNSMSQAGTDSLLADVLLLVESNLDILHSSFGDETVLAPLVKRLHFILGSKLPTNPFGMAQINEIMSQYFEKYEYLDLIGIVTQESWLVNVNTRENENRRYVTSQIWKNSVEMLHQFLGRVTNGLIINDAESVFWSRPVYYRNPRTKSGISWWGLLIQINIDLLDNVVIDKNERDLQFNIDYVLNNDFYKLVIDRLDFEFYEKIAPIIRDMVERELRTMGRSGVLGQILSFAEYTYPDGFNMQLNAINTSEFTTSDNVKGSWKTFLDNYYSVVQNKFPESQYVINQNDLVFITLTQDHLLDLFGIILDIAENFDNENMFTIFLGLGTGEFRDRIMERTSSLKIANQMIYLFSEDEIEVESDSENIKIFDQINIDAQISEYLFFALENEELSINGVFYMETGGVYTGVWSHSNDLNELISSRVKQLHQMS